MNGITENSCSLYLYTALNPIPEEINPNTTNHIIKFKEYVSVNTISPNLSISHDIYNAYKINYLSDFNLIEKIKEAVIFLEVFPTQIEVFETSNWDYLNREIENLLQQLEDQDSHSNDTLIATLCRIGNYHQNAIFEMHIKGEIPCEEMIYLLYSTCFDSEIKEQDEHFFSRAPNTLIVLFFIKQFFLKKSLDQIMQPHEIGFLKLIQQSSHLLYMLHAVSSYLLDQQEEYEQAILTLITEYIYERMISLSVNDQFLLPGGWVSLNSSDFPIEGHFMFYLIEKSDSFLIKNRINTHLLLSEFREENDDLHWKTIDRKQFKDDDEHVKSFISKCIDLLIPKRMKNRMKFIPPSEQIDALYKINAGKKLKQPNPYPIELEPQKFSANCCFMSCLALYQYVYQKTYEHSFRSSIEQQTATQENAEEFRGQFRNYIVSQLQAGIVQDNS